MSALTFSLYLCILSLTTTKGSKMNNPFWTVTNWIDENMDYAPIGAFIGLGIAILIAVIFGGW